MSTAGLASHVALVLTADPGRYHEIFRPALAMATAPDGERMEPVWLDTRRADEMASDAELDALDRGPCVVVDLMGLSPRLFGLVAWHARATGRRVILLRLTDAALPFELRDFAVEPLDLSAPGAAAHARERIAERATMAGVMVTGVPGASFEARQARWKRREKNGVALLLRLAGSLLLMNDLEAALGQMESVLAVEQDAADLHLRRALLVRELGQWPEAAASLERAVGLEPDLGAAWRELGVARQRGGLPGADSALERAADLDDYAGLVALSGLKGLSGDRHGSLRLLERAAESAGGQWNLALPIALTRASLAGRVDLDATIRQRLERVRALRRAQADAAPAADMPWSAFDAALCALLLGDGADAVRLAGSAKASVHASWESDPFALALEQLAQAGVDVVPTREAAGVVVKPRRVEAPAAPAAPAGPPFRVAAREPSWFSSNVPCATACPVGTDAGTYVMLVAQGQDAEAYRTARGPNPFASVCGHVCAAPCEEACRRGRLDQPVTIRALKRFVAERHGPGSPDDRLASVLDGSLVEGLEGEACVSLLRKRGQASGSGGRAVAVVGGGPAGLACAHDLAFLGYRVTVFEASDRLGGMMRHGIPEHRLPRDVLDRDIQAVLSLGVDVRLNTPLNRERNLTWLTQQGYEAVFLASGAGRGRDLDVEGSGLDGVVRAIEFLINVNAGFRMDLGQRVVVVGGGNVAIDVARTARRGTTFAASADAREAARALGPSLPSDALRRAVGGTPREVHLVARPPLGQWPAQEGLHGREEVDEARREGIAFHPLRGVRRILGENGRVTAVELAEVVRLTDEQGRYAPAYGPHPAETIPCDAVLLAVGQEPDLAYAEGTAGLKRARGGLIDVDRATLATSVGHVFAGGDAAFGPRTLIEAVAEGKRAARSIHARLSGPKALPRRHRFEDLDPRAVTADPYYDHLERRDPACEPLDRRTGIAEVERGFTQDEARRQASRCLACHVQTVFDGDLCVACGRCVDVCPHTCLSLVPLADLGGLDPATAEVLEERGGPGRVAMLKDDDICIRCGLCALRCPTGAMTMERYGATTLETHA